MKFSSSFKVGLLTLVALILLVGTVLKVKGRAFSSAKRVEIQFKDVNGLRPGAGVQIMGLKVGQVEEITPVANGEDSFVKVKFVITDPNVQIPRASSFSIQQSGLIGELFLEITPPKTRTVYIPMLSRHLLYKNDPVQMKLIDKYYDVGLIKSVEVLSRDSVPFNYKNNIRTPYAYKVDYFINLPGLIMPEFLKGAAVNDGESHKLRLTPLDDMPLAYPSQDSPYTIIEPMRLSDFMDWQYRAAETLTETTRKVNEILKRLFMGKLDIELTQKSTNETEKYILRRNGEPAHHLSEGEKTAISFAHFLASLESKDLVDKYGEIILYIDDPISSLDNNHIYAIFAEIDRLRQEVKKRKYKQLFISTHNYHLFRLLTEKDEKNIGVYYIQRNKQNSIISNFPKNILQQKAEYTFLFHQIKKYIANPYEDDYTIGHFLRRFLEIFATYKNPTK